MTMHGLRADKLYALAFERLDRRRPGFGMPILWHLALRRHSDAMIALSSYLEAPGPISDPFSAAGLAYRAYRKGNVLGAQHLALDHFNRGDLGGCRKWLQRAARLGDADAAKKLSRFEIRLPHGNAAKIGRKRPGRKDDD